MNFIQKAQQVVDATPASASWGIMIGSLLMSILQPIAVAITIVWGGLQIHGYVKREWGWEWLTRIFGKGK